MNPLTDQYPAIIARCARPEDVARCLEFARRYDLPIAVRSGGHSFLGWSTCNDGFVIDVSRLDQVVVDPVRRVARVGAGIQAQQLVSASSRYGLVPVLGECATVGAAGLTLGGGLGWLSATYGAACDNLLSANLLTVDGRSVETSATSEPDLFWAIRGGGGNFGVLTRMDYRLQAIDQVVAGGFAYRLSDARSVLQHYREYMAGAPDALQAIAYLTPAGGGALNVVIVCIDTRVAERAAEQFRSFAAPVRETLQRRSYTETFTMTLLPELEAVPAGTAIPAAFRTDMGVYLTRLSDEAIDVALDRFPLAPAGSQCRIGFDHFMHGAVCRFPPASTAFELRQPGALHCWVSSAWKDPVSAAGCMTWAMDTWQLMRPFSGERIYTNYASFEGVTAAERMFGSNLPRLTAIKKNYDPTNVLKRNQNIQPKG